MNIKTYLDYFDEISDLPRDEQFTLLEKAHKLVQNESSVSKFTLVSFLIPTFSIMVLVGGSVLIFGSSLFAIIISLIFGLLLSRVLVNELNTFLLLKGLTQVISKANSHG